MCFMNDCPIVQIISSNNVDSTQDADAFFQPYKCAKEKFS